MVFCAEDSARYNSRQARAAQGLLFLAEIRLRCHIDSCGETAHRYNEDQVTTP